MAFDATKLRKTAEGLFTYNAGADTAATVTASGYFNAATHMLKQDDVIAVIGAGRTTLDMVAIGSATGAATVTTVSAEGVTTT